jgi:hypothetical protein
VGIPVRSADNKYQATDPFEITMNDGRLHGVENAKPFGNALNL